jgi:pilus assembly protein CpaC
MTQSSRGRRAVAQSVGRAAACLVSVYALTTLAIAVAAIFFGPSTDACAVEYIELASDSDLFRFDKELFADAKPSTEPAVKHEGPWGQATSFLNRPKSASQLEEKLEPAVGFGLPCVFVKKDPAANPPTAVQTGIWQLHDDVVVSAPVSGRVFNILRLGDSPISPAEQHRDVQPAQFQRTVPESDEAPPVAPVQPVAAVQPVAPVQDDIVFDEDGPFEVLEQTREMKVTLRRSKLLRSKVDVYRTAVVDPSICDVIQFTPREVSIIGRGQGATHVTFWFEDGRHQPITYLVEVAPDPVERKRIEDSFDLLADMLAELFPDSKVQLIPMADKLIVRGQAKGAEEAARIMGIIRGQTDGNRGGRSGIGEGTAARVLTAEETGRTPWPRMEVINMLQVPGVQQVALRVKIAEVSRSAAREFGVDLDMKLDFGGTSALLIESLLAAAAGGSTSIMGQFDGDDIQFGIHYLQQRGVLRVLSEPTLVTMSGRPATFVAGGEFAVPTVVGVGGASAVTTDFRAFGAIISFLPVVIDKDRIRLEISPEFSKISEDLTVGGTPGLDVRAVTTTVEMREGQTLAVAGLLDDSMTANTAGDVPFLAKVFGNRSVSRNETELIILVTPELIHPMEPEEVPPLPGFDITEPDNRHFFIRGDIEGKPTLDYNSAVWPRLRNRYQAGGPAMISGPFGHGQ